MTRKFLQKKNSLRKKNGINLFREILAKKWQENFTEKSACEKNGMNFFREILA
jgi:hypothetical protein